MFLRRNVASQTITIPGSLRLIADGSAVTSGATIYLNGSGTAGGGTLTHWRSGVWRYTPTLAETDVPIVEYVLEATNAVSLSGSIRTTQADPNDAAGLGLTRLDATVSSRSTYAGTDTSGTSTLLSRLTSLRASNLDLLDAAISAVLTALGTKASQTSVDALPTSAAIADKVLGRNLAGGSDGGRTVRDALRFSRNKVTIDPVTGAITVYAEDDTTVAWTGVVTRTAGLNPISGVDPA